MDGVWTPPVGGGGVQQPSPFFFQPAADPPPSRHGGVCILGGTYCSHVGSGGRVLFRSPCWSCWGRVSEEELRSPRQPRRDRISISFFFLFLDAIRWASPPLVDCLCPYGDQQPGGTFVLRLGGGCQLDNRSKRKSEGTQGLPQQKNQVKIFLWTPCT